MTLQSWFWLFMAFWLIFGFWRGYKPDGPYQFDVAGGHLLTFILFAILGWKVFGSPLQ